VGKNSARRRQSDDGASADAHEFRHRRAPCAAVDRVPTLLLHPTRDQTISVDCSRYMAQRIPGAKLLEIDSDDHLAFLVRPNEIPDLVQEFLTGGRGAVDEDRVVKTVMFSDIVGSTELAAKLGDARWRDLRDAHHAAVRRELAIYRGQEVDTAGDGFYAAFDGPARAIRCACEVRNSVKSPRHDDAPWTAHRRVRDR